jgi:hypothetical protein
VGEWKYSFTLTSALDEGEASFSLPCRFTPGDSQSQLLYDWQFTANQFVLATSHLRVKTSIFFFFLLNTCGRSPYITSSLTRGCVCRLQLLLALASADILRSESSGTHDHILLSQIRDSPNLEGQVPVFVNPRHWVPFSALLRAVPTIQIK